MTFFGANLLTAIATAVLAVFAVVTAWYARRAFLKQSQEVTAIERQVADGQEVSRQQAELLKVQTGQLELQRVQLDDQRKASAAQAEVLELQAAELRESLEERKREAERRRRAQASHVFITEKKNIVETGGEPQIAAMDATVENSSDEPIYDAEVRWYALGAGELDRLHLGVLLPGTKAKNNRRYPINVNPEDARADVRFVDAAGIRWYRGPDGYLGEQD